MIPLKLIKIQNGLVIKYRPVFVTASQIHTLGLWLVHGLAWRGYVNSGVVKHELSTCQFQLIQ